MQPLQQMVEKIEQNNPFVFKQYPLTWLIGPMAIVMETIICYKHCQGTWLGARSVSHASQACPDPATATPLVNWKTGQRFVHITLPTLSYYFHQKYCQIL